MPTKYCTVDGTALHYFHAGRTTLPNVPPDLRRGEFLVFIHGAGSNGHTWQRQLDAFADDHSPLAVDLPGHGRSGGTDGLTRVEAYRDCLAAFLAAVQPRPAVLVGRSMGGAIAMAYALAHPQRVRALVLVATAARFDLPDAFLATWHDVMRGRLQQPFTTHAFSPNAESALVRESWMEQIKTDPRVRYIDLVACRECDLRPQLAAIAAPTLIVAGRDDTITPVACSEALHRGIHGSHLVVLDDAGHSLTIEKPAEFNAAVRQFLATLEPRR